MATVLRVRQPKPTDVVPLFGPLPTGSPVPLECFSQIYDVLNDLVVDADLFAKEVGMRVPAAEHLAATGPADLILSDHGHPAFWSFVLRHMEQCKF